MVGITLVVVVLVAVYVIFITNQSTAHSPSAAAHDGKTASVTPVLSNSSPTTNLLSTSSAKAGANSPIKPARSIPVTVASRFPGATNWLANSRFRQALKSADSNAFPAIIEMNGRQYLNITFAQLACFQFDENPQLVDENLNPDASYHARNQVPDAVKNLGEKSAAVTGFMLPLHTQDGLATDFLLLRNQSACCLGIMPRINEYVIVHASPGLKSIKDVAITALGTFHLCEMRQGGHLIGIYLFDFERLLPAK